MHACLKRQRSKVKTHEKERKRERKQTDFLGYATRYHHPWRDQAASASPMFGNCNVHVSMAPTIKDYEKLVYNEISLIN